MVLLLGLWVDVNCHRAVLYCTPVVQQLSFDVGMGFYLVYLTILGRTSCVARLNIYGSGYGSILRALG